jgi:UDPglucose 6-dehydrogenase
MIVGIIGNGFVGKATFQLKCKDIDILAYDINPASCVPEGLVLADMNKCELVFISVPTPMSKNGSCHLNIIESVLRDLASIDYKGFVVLRSTVPVGTCDKLNCYFMPEFLTEKNFIDDFINNKDWMFGLLGKPEDEQMKEKISALFSLAHANDRIKHNNLHFITNKEAEMIKMFKNCYLSTKVSFCNEIYQFCEQKQVNYEVVRALATADERILSSHTRVPGHDGQRGFGGTCFPKDTSSLRYEMQQANMTPYILNAIIERNELVDRPQKDWLLDKGRAAVDE